VYQNRERVEKNNDREPRLAMAQGWNFLFATNRIKTEAAGRLNISRLMLVVPQILIVWEMSGVYVCIEQGISSKEAAELNSQLVSVKTEWSSLLFCHIVFFSYQCTTRNISSF
jgi:hypothetical protein